MAHIGELLQLRMPELTEAGPDPKDPLFNSLTKKWTYSLWETRLFIVMYLSNSACFWSRGFCFWAPSEQVCVKIGDKTNGGCPFGFPANQSEKGTLTHTHTDTRTNKQTSKQTSKQANKQTSKQASKQANKQTIKQTNKQTIKQTNKQTINQTIKQASKQ